ncbi:MAG TPA: hypothetical protein VD994_16965, partial [Prosthecobacter sp.]|nr:hypothetical protein [Prosthecobacter sp.]
MKWVLLLFTLVFAAGVANAQERRLETLLLLPEPRALRSDLSVTPKGAVKTVLTPARERLDVPGIETYSKEEFKKLGLSVETFAARSRAAADKLLASFKPELARDEDGKVIYALYRSERPVVASLLLAPSLPKVFEELFGKEIWVAMPNRYSLFVFPAQPEVLQEFAEELRERYENDAYAASGEIF